MADETAVFILRKGRLLVPEEHRSAITSHVILSTYSGNLWLFPSTRWENILPK